jgi:hypothetical protein
MESKERSPLVKCDYYSRLSGDDQSIAISKLCLGHRLL